MRCVLALTLIGVVSAHWHDFESFGKGKGKGKDKGKGKGKGKEYSDMPPEARAEFHEAHLCHWNCAEDKDCHEKCPNPWSKLVDVCHQMPEIKACYAKCRVSLEEDWNGLSEDCLKTCPAIHVDWIQKKFEENPEMVIAKSEYKCPELEKRYACHQACSAGDFECHGKCHHEHGWHHAHGDIDGDVEHGWHDHGDWHHHDRHHDTPHQNPEQQVEESAVAVEKAVRTEPQVSKPQLSTQTSFSAASKMLKILSDSFMELISDLRSYRQSDTGDHSVVV